MSQPWPYWFSNWPKQLPFPVPLQRNRGPVPNRQSVDWAQSQFAPLYLQPGSASFQNFRYPPHGPLTRVKPLYRLEGDAFPYLHSMVGPDGDIAQVPPSYGETMPYAARFNQGEAVAADQLLVAGASEIGPELSVADTAIVEEAEIATAAAVAAEAPFEPFAPELLIGLRPHVLKRLQKLESILNKLSTVDRGPALEKVYSGLLKAHDRLEKRLEKRHERREKKKGRHGKAKKFLQSLRRRHLVEKAKKDDDKVAKVQQIKAAYAAGGITQERAKNLVNAVIKPGKQLEHPNIVAAKIAAKARANGRF